MLSILQNYVFAKLHSLNFLIFMWTKSRALDSLKHLMFNIGYNKIMKLLLHYWKRWKKLRRLYSFLIELCPYNIWVSHYCVNVRLGINLIFRRWKKETNHWNKCVFYRRPPSPGHNYAAGLNEIRHCKK